MSSTDFDFGHEMPSATTRPIACPVCAELPLCRFGTRQILWFFAAASAFFAVLVSSDGVTALIITVMTMIVVAHISATAIGTRLRSHATVQKRFEVVGEPPVDVITAVVIGHEHVSAIHAEPRSPWHGRGTTSLPWLRQFVFGAVFVGGLTGVISLATLVGHRPSAAGIAIGGLSAAVLSGWFAFLCGSFYGVFRHGFRDAAAPSITAPE